MNGQDEQFWFEVGDILDLDTHQKVNKYMIENNLIDNDYAMNTLVKLFSVIHTERLINYYLQEDDEADKVLEIFIRTNSGGTPLSFSDLLMSIASANWQILDARKEMEKIIKEVNDIGHAGFKIDKNLVLKIFLFLFSEDIRFKLDNFSQQKVKVFANQNLHQDHLHPAKFFTNEKYFKENIPQEIQDFAKDEKNWNSVANLQLLPGNQNVSKNDMSLKEWAAKHKKTNQDLFLSEGTSLNIEDFEEFILDRRKNLEQRLKEIVRP